MQNIKFRIWNDIGKGMYSVTGLHFFEGGELSSVSFDSENGEIQDISLNNDRFIIEQYTGLKDKNGKEIYEGDITNNKEVVIFESGGFSPFSISGWEGSAEWEKIEIIGNIHENKEILK